MEDARVRVHNDEEWASDMDAADFDRYDIETAARNEGHTAGIAAVLEYVHTGEGGERSRETALLNVMSSEGLGLEEVLGGHNPRRALPRIRHRVSAPRTGKAAYYGCRSRRQEAPEAQSGIGAG